ncbi:hypothetical protein SAMN04488505_10213 [Chitinophaga rupis]|uniref:Uncharacterized protein n=1 Tax=Chitinophaga rupis TaxID=573321 RepID=A0A1H7P690_9BACT|nr:hypothetical protein [Chitinophaga rupis]SEL31370.1 hypothetical protein SAMN04488505_10213 [Chitinophaga rupis]
MRNNISNILLGLGFAGLLIGSAYIQTDLKNKPQIFMLLFGALTLISFFTKYETVSTTLLYLLLGALLFMDYCFFTIWIDGIISIHPDWTGIYGMLTGLILSPLTILFYHKIKRRNRKMEVAVITIFMFVTAIIYVKYELFQ